VKAQSLYRIFGVVILAGVALQRAVAMHRPESMVRNHEHIRALAEALPHRIGAWVGEDVVVPVQALNVLRPNVMLSRRYVNLENGCNAGFLLVHCSDAHAMAGHFPLRCYTARGWDVQGSRPRDWKVDSLLLSGMEYTFSLDGEGMGSKGARSIIVANCLFRPGGKVLRDMDAMIKSVIGAGGQASGAGQMQIYFDAGVPQNERDAAVVALAGGYKEVIEAILSGASK
jgi:hypothetical protein